MLASAGRRVRLFYANRSPESVIFGEALSALAEANPDRLTVVHHFDEQGGVVTPSAVEAFVDAAADADYYICGPRAVHGHRVRRVARHRCRA